MDRKKNMFYLYFSLFNKNIHEVKNIAIRIVSHVSWYVSYRENVYRYIPTSIWSGPKDVSLVTAMCDRDYIAGEAQMHRKLRCDTG